MTTGGVARAYEGLSAPLAPSATSARVGNVHGGVYRPDVDGLRAVAVLAVVVYHAFPSRAPGGFVGVDIFFVISGYLISRIILGDLQRDTFSIRRFYAKRIRRIFPALIVVMATLLVAGWWLLLSDEFRALGKHVVAGGGFVSNIALWRESGYFEAAAELKPLLHLWSLGIEEQFYLIWPAMAWLAWHRGRRVTHAVVAMFAVSFLLNVLFVRIRPAATFYLPVTRFWELMAGCAIAVWSLRAAPTAGAAGPGTGGAIMRRSAAEIASWAGAAMLVVAIAVLDNAKRFPGWWALLPVGGSALLIAAGPGTWVNREILSRKPVVAIGLVSYPLYLWHWPLLWVLRLKGSTVPAGYRAGAVVAALALAGLTYRYVERPVRFHRSRRTPPMLIAAMAMVMLAGGLVYRGRIASRAFPRDAQILEAKGDWAYPAANGEALGIPLRIVGSGAERVLFVGDSHIEQYYPRIERIVREHPGGRAAVFMTGGGCPPLPTVSERQHDCAPYMQRLPELAQKLGATRIVIGASWHSYLTGGGYAYRVHGSAGELALESVAGRATALALLEDELRRLGARGIKLYVVLAGPHGDEMDPAQMARREWLTGITFRYADVNRIALERQYATVDSAVEAMAVRVPASVINPRDHLCTLSACPSTDAGKPRFKDATHLRASWVRENVHYLDDAVLR